jgi:hypothetical protein
MRRNFAVRCKGRVHGNTVILDEGISLPDGTRVTVTVEQENLTEEAITHEELVQRRALAAQMEAFGQQLAGRHISLGDVVLEGKEELEDRA